MKAWAHVNKSSSGPIYEYLREDPTHVPVLATVLKGADPSYTSTQPFRNQDSGHAFCSEEFFCACGPCHVTQPTHQLF